MEQKHRKEISKIRIVFSPLPSVLKQQEKLHFGRLRQLEPRREQSQTRRRLPWSDGVSSVTCMRGLPRRGRRACVRIAAGSVIKPFAKFILRHSAFAGVVDAPSNWWEEIWRVCSVECIHLCCLFWRGGATTVQAVTRCVMSKVIPTGMLLITDIRGRHDASQEEAYYKENGPFWISNEVKRQEGAAVDATTQR